MRLKLVDTGIEANQQEQNDARGDANGQAENIDQCIIAIAQEIPERQGEVVSYHAIVMAKVCTNIVLYCNSVRCRINAIMEVRDGVSLSIHLDV